jgi:hypothetical protein
MVEQIIHVGLYGGKSIFGGRETPQRAEIIYCDRFDKCSYYKNGQCLNVTAPLSSYCKYGRISTVHGYTSRAKKYNEFDSKWREHEKYRKLSYPPKKLGLIDDIVVFPYPHIYIKESEDGYIELHNPGFCSGIAFIDYNKFTVDFIRRLCLFRPLAIMGGEIRSYKTETVPLFLAHLKEVLPERYEEVKAKYPEIIKEINYVGRTALLKTIAPSHVYYKSSRYPQYNEKWYWDGETLKYESGYVSSFNITKDYEILEIRIRPSDTSTITISNNEQVTENTVFID